MNVPLFVLATSVASPFACHQLTRFGGGVKQVAAEVNRAHKIKKLRKTIGLPATQCAEGLWWFIVVTSASPCSLVQLRAQFLAKIGN